MRRFGPYLLLALPLALLAAIAVPNLLTARNRSRQKRTMADMRLIATVLEAYASELNTYAIDPAAATSTSEDFASLTPVSFDTLDRALNPKYIRKPLPRRDGWGNELDVRIGARDYAIRSRGSDGRSDRATYAIMYTPTSSFEEDLVFSDGNFLQAPEGL